MKTSTNRKNLTNRAAGVLVVLILIFSLVAVNLARIMLVNDEKYKAKAENNQLQDSKIDALRGDIYDANGVMLAQSASVWKIYINPSRIPDDEGVKTFLCTRLTDVMTDLDYDTLRAKCDLNGNYYTVKSQVEKAEKDAVAKLLYNSKDTENGITDDMVKLNQTTYKVSVENEDGETVLKDKTFYISSAIGIDPDTKRYYPCGTLAAAVLGFTGADDDGRSGLEAQYDSILTGTPGRIISAKNGRSDLMGDEYESIYDAEKGHSLKLTLDTTIQRYLEEELQDVYVESGGVGAYGIVMDVDTGAILAMANLPGFDPNNPYALYDSQKAELDTITDEDEKATAKSNFYFSNWRNFTVSDTYEPGSVFKTVTASAGLESGAVTMAFEYTCYGSIQVADRTIKCHDHSGHGYQTLREGLMNSCNPFFIRVGQTMGAETFSKFFEAFGFTEKTGIDLPAEPQPVADSTYHALENMGLVELSSSSFGQSFQVTPIQMITALSAIANGGNLVTPYVVDEIMDANGNVISKTEPKIRRQVISEETASLVTSMMESVVTAGTGKNAYVAGYRVAGKTGTSQKLSKGSGYYVASFGCFAPADDPEVAALIIVDEPKGQINGGQICTPVAAKVIEKTLEYLNVDRRYTEEELAELDTQMPNLIGQSAYDAAVELRAQGYTVRIVGNGETVVSQMPSYNELIPQNGVVVLYSEQESDKLTVTVPSLVGYTMSQAKAYAAEQGLNISVSGNLSSNALISYDQSVAAGTEVEFGTTVTVYFKSNSGVSDFSD